MTASGSCRRRRVPCRDMAVVRNGCSIDALLNMPWRVYSGVTVPSSIFCFIIGNAALQRRVVELEEWPWDGYSSESKGQI